MSTGSVLLLAHRFPGTAEGCREFLRAGAAGFEMDLQLRGRRVLVSHYLPFLQIHGWFQHDGTRFRWRDGPPYDPTLAATRGTTSEDGDVEVEREQFFKEMKRREF